MWKPFNPKIALFPGLNLMLLAAPLAFLLAGGIPLINSVANQNWKSDQSEEGDVQNLAWQLGVTLGMASTEGLVPITRKFLASYYDKYSLDPISDDVSRLSTEIRFLADDLLHQSPPNQGSCISSSCLFIQSIFLK